MAEETTGLRLTPAKVVRESKFKGISPMTEWRWQQNLGMPKPIKIGGMNFYDERALDTWIESFRTTGEAGVNDV